MTRINTNVSSLVAQNRLNKTNNDLNTSLTRLSTGLRINTGKDDPAGLIASEALRSDITSINKAISNTQRASQIIATADSALGQVSSLLNDVRGLVVEAANSGALSDDEIAANQLQVDSSLQAINRIAQTTTFQGRKLLDGSLDFSTTSGTNFTSIKDLRINQANLGSAGALALDIEISSAATRARVEVANIPAAGEAGTGAVTLTNAAANAEASTAALTTAAGADFEFGVVDGSSLDGTDGNAVTVNVVAGSTAAATQATSGVQVVNTTGQFLVGIQSDSQYAGAAGNALDVVVEAGNTATGQAESSAFDVNGVVGAFTVSAAADGAYDGALGNAATVEITHGGAAASGIVVTDTAGDLTIALEAGVAFSIQDVKDAVDAAVGADFEVNIASGAENTLFQGDGSDAIAQTLLNTGTAGTSADASFSFDGTTLTITTNNAADTALSDIKAALDADATFAADFTFNVGTDVDFQADGSDDIGSTGLTGGTNVAAEAVFADNVLTVTVDDSADTALSDIKAALDLDSNFTDLFSITVNTDNDFAADGTDDIADEAFTGGTDTTTEDVLTVTGPAGELNNGDISIVQSASVTTPEAEVDEDGNITIRVSNTASTSLSAIKTAIDGLNGYSAEVTATAGDATFAPSTDSLATTAISGATDGGITNDLVFELGGLTGAQVFEVSAGTTIDQLREQINLVSEATGVEAVANDDTLVFRSTDYGSKAKVDIRIINEAATGTFTSEIGVRANDVGTDVLAKINGVDASADGNELKVKTSTLDIELTVGDGFSGNIDFTVTGGGAKFQLGPEVVANQQARIGISSLNTARLGGVSGRLYQLAEGGSAALAENPTLAAEIVDEAINQVTGLRGRLGAFQATTLESNLVSLNDTVVNLQEAESSIRDADFAAESARLTRAQILVQSGTSVLGIANQNPQNVLGLLR